MWTARRPSGTEPGAREEPAGVDAPRARGTPQGEAVAVWTLWALVVLAIAITYSWLDPTELYRVDRDGVVGGLSRALVAVNFPVALIAVALVIVAMDALPLRAWWIGAPAIVLCAVTAVPGVVDDHDLDARPVNVLPALGVAIAVGLTVAAARRDGMGVAARLPLDRARWLVIAVAAVISLPWIFADLGWYAPEWFFIMERPITGSDGTIGPAVHLGHHHGLDGAFFVISAALLTRVGLQSRRLAIGARWYLALLFAYGAVNGVQDAWNEQLAKRGWVDWTIPSALNPALEPIWLVIAIIAVATAVVLRRESDGEDGGRRVVAPAPRHPVE